jgi:uncharacterized protein YggU (UPF0235/DUF167 family)
MLRASVEAHPNARVDRVELAETTLRVWVRARAIDGQANDAIERSIAQALGLRSRQVRIVSGPRTRHKIVELDLVDFEELRRRLARSSTS